MFTPFSFSASHVLIQIISVGNKWEGNGWATTQECIQWPNGLSNSSPVCLHQLESYQQHMSSSCNAHLTTLLILWLTANKDLSQICQWPVCKLLVIPQVQLLALFPRIKKKIINVQTAILNINEIQKILLFNQILTFFVTANVHWRKKNQDFCWMCIREIYSGFSKQKSVCLNRLAASGFQQELSN